MQGIAGVAVASLTREFGCRAEDLIAGIGPCLGPCCGEMGPEVVDMFRAAGHDDGHIGRWFRTGASGRPYFDLWRANREQLEGLDWGRSASSRPACAAAIIRTCFIPIVRRIGAGRMLGIIRGR